MKPRLIHPVKVKICNVDKVETLYDEDFGEPISSDGVSGGDVIFGDPIDMLAQVRYFKRETIEEIAAGFQNIGDGYLIVYKEDFTKISVNAKITEIDGEVVDYYVIDTPPLAHYNSSNLRKIIFKSKDKGTD